MTDVPNTPGVPPIRDAAPADNAPPLTSDGPRVAGQPLPRWGLYTTGGAIALEADNVISFDHGQEFRVADYPIEEGGFESYNKVAVPTDIRLLFTKGGTEADRTKFMTTIDTIVASTTLYNVVTPEKTYLRMNVIRQTQRRSAEGGAQLIGIELQLREIRNATKAVFTSTKAPSGAKAVNDGAVQPVTPAAGQTPAKAPR